MRITIHRGIDQIGGCITEIATGTTRILIDLGQNLPGEAGENDPLASREAVEKITNGVDAIFYTHYHGDHIGLFHFVPDTIPQYIGGAAKLVTLRKHIQLSLIPDRAELSEREIAILKAMHTFDAGKSVTVGDIKITPYFVSHSACDAYMFLIEAGERRIWHTGDFRGHGYLSKGLLPTIQKLILPRGTVDFLITEGTLLSRRSENVLSELELQTRFANLMQRYKYVFVLCSSTDIERLASIYAANRKMRNRPFVCDTYQKDILSIFSDTKGDKNSLFHFDKVYDFYPNNLKLVDWMRRDGFCMLVRASEKGKASLIDVKYLLPLIDPQQTIIVYSMWGEYINPDGKHANKAHLDFISLFPNVERLHTSGHATAQCLADVCNLMNPSAGIIPIHSESSVTFANLPINKPLQEKVITSSRVVNEVDIEIYPSPVVRKGAVLK